MQIAILGAGLVGSTLGQLWHAAGHDVTFAAPDLAFGQDDPNPVSALGRADPTARTQAELRLFGHLEKPIGDAALIEHFDGARVQTAGA